MDGYRETGLDPALCDIAVEGHTSPVSHSPTGCVHVRARVLTIPGTCTLWYIFLNTIADLLLKGSYASCKRWSGEERKKDGLAASGAELDV